MDALGWDSCDIVIVTGDAYVDHPASAWPSLAACWRTRASVGIIAQPDWLSADPSRAGQAQPVLGRGCGNMDSMINRYTADRKIRSDDAYTPVAWVARGLTAACRLPSAAAKPSKTCPSWGGIEASLRRIAHYDYWSDKVRRSILMDAKADLLLYGNAERAIIEVAHRLAAGEPVSTLTDVRGTAFIRRRNDPRPKTGLSSIPRKWTCRAASTSTSTLHDHRPASSRTR